MKRTRKPVPVEARRPLRTRLFTWTRVVDGDRLEYRLFQRLSTGAFFMESHAFRAETLAAAAPLARVRIATELRYLRRKLRWRRDRLEFAGMGLDDDTPEPVRP